MSNNITLTSRIKSSTVRVCSRSQVSSIYFVHRSAPSVVRSSKTPPVIVNQSVRLASKKSLPPTVSSAAVAEDDGLPQQIMPMNVFDAEQRSSDSNEPLHSANMNTICGRSPCG